jgi:hypothetical protein
MQILFAMLLFIASVLQSSQVTHEKVFKAETIPQKHTTDQWPIKLNGFAEDEAVSVRFSADFDPDKQRYKTTISFTNKTNKSLDILADCGLFFSTDNFAAGAEVCPAVESMLVKKQKKETQTVYLPRDFFVETSKIVSVKYRQDQNVKILSFQLENMGDRE